MNLKFAKYGRNDRLMRLSAQSISLQNDIDQYSID